MKPKTAGRTSGEDHFADHIGPAPSRQSTLYQGALTGLVTGAKIMTMAGLRPIQNLTAGEKIITRGNGAVTIRQIARRSFIAPAVYFIAGSLGHRQTDRDTLLPATQPVFVRDWRARAMGYPGGIALTASTLVDGEFVRDLGYLPLTVYQLFCDAPQIIYADGMELGTADCAVTTRLNKAA